MKKAIKAIVCDFDGTFSTLRCGWEGVMKKSIIPESLRCPEKTFSAKTAMTRLHLMVDLPLMEYILSEMTLRY